MLFPVLGEFSPVLRHERAILSRTRVTCSRPQETDTKSQQHNKSLIPLNTTCHLPKNKRYQWIMLEIWSAHLYALSRDVFSCWDSRSVCRSPRRYTWNVHQEAQEALEHVYTHSKISERKRNGFHVIFKAYSYGSWSVCVLSWVFSRLFFLKLLPHPSNKHWRKNETHRPMLGPELTSVHHSHPHHGTLLPREHLRNILNTEITTIFTTKVRIHQHGTYSV